MKSKQYFGTDGIRGKVGVAPITPEQILKLGWALGSVLKEVENSQPKKQKQPKLKVLIGKDTRVSGYLLESALEAGLSAAGVDICLLGPIPTPGVAFLTRALRADVGIVISASHNPYDDNGVKIFNKEGTKLSDSLELSIEAKMNDPLVMVASQFLGKATRLEDAQGRYVEFCKSTFPANLNLKGLTIVLDCAHGATYLVAPKVFRELGATVIEHNVEPDGFNINQACGSLHPQGLSEKVIQAKADLGIAFDGDGDRVIMADHTGEIVDGDELLYIIAKWYQSTHRLEGGVVGTLMSNYGLELAFQELGIPFSRSAVGDRYVFEMLKQKSWNLGGETSGHIICLDANSTGDGIISALRLLAVMCTSQQSLYTLKQGMQKCPQILINVKVADKAGTALVVNNPKVKAALQQAETNLNGHGRVLLRPSGTEPVVRVMVEGQDQRLVQSVAEGLAEAVRGVR